MSWTKRLHLSAPEYYEMFSPELEENRDGPCLVLVGDARLERATFGSGVLKKK
jgi:hypothetical protein